MTINSTMFAPAERADAESIRHDTKTLNPVIFAEHVVQAVPCVVMVLNRQRQIVYKNQKLMDLLGASCDEDVLGKRPGEILNCIHAFDNEAGCGTSEFCRECGAVKAILKSQNEMGSVTEECRITSTSGDAFDFQVIASPFTYAERDYTIFVIDDIRDKKRRYALERTFFHDIKNTLNAIVGGSTLIGMSKNPDIVTKYARIVQTAGRELTEDIEFYRTLLRAEDGLLKPAISTVPSSSILRDVTEFFSDNQKWKNRKVIIDNGSEEFEIETDSNLLNSVLHNMLENALEATSEEDKITLTCTKNRSSVVFSVHNPGYIPHSIQLQLYQRSFSTKGKGRGIGAYSMKLFGEQHLKGTVWFSSSEENGTTFFISIPLSYEDKEV